MSDNILVAISADVHVTNHEQNMKKSALKPTKTCKGKNMSTSQISHNAPPTNVET